MSKFQCDNDNEHIKLYKCVSEIKRSAVQTLYQGNNQLISIFQEEFPPLDTTKDTTIERMLAVTGELPQVSGDEIIQIGTGFKDMLIKSQHYGILLPEIHVTLFQTRLRNNMIPKKRLSCAGTIYQSSDPDVISGYNVFGLISHTWKRAQE